MSELAASLPLPPAVRPSADKKLAHHLRNQRLIMASYGVDGFVLLLFMLAGTIGWAPVVAYTAGGLAITGVAYAAIASGRTRHLRDTGIAIPQTIPAQLLQLACMAFVPQLSFMFALLLFLVYSTLTLTLDVRRSLVTWAFATMGTACVLGIAGTPLRIPSENLAEQAISFGFFVLTLWRCVWIGRFNSHMTERLKARGQELAALTEQVDQLAHYDELTGVMNRRSLFAALHDEMLRAQRSGQPLCVALMDLDRFKSINDSLGHLAGDRVLKTFARTLAPQTRKSDRFGRHGGEEFMLVMTATPPTTAALPLQRMREALAQVDWGTVAPGLNVTFSCGITQYRPGERVEALLQRADEALYRAKADGRNCTREA